MIMKPTASARALHMHACVCTCIYTHAYSHAYEHVYTHATSASIPYAQPHALYPGALYRLYFGIADGMTNARV